jgi:type III secretion protein J
MDEKEIEAPVSWTKDFFSLSKLLTEKFLALIVLIGIISFAFSGCESKKTIVNGIDEREANEILVLLASKNINAYKLKEAEAAGGGGPKIILWDIAVDTADATTAMAILSANGLPRRHSQNLLQIFSAGGLVPSDLQEKIRYQAGLADQIASTIRKIDGIVDADIQLSFPEEDPLNPNAQKGPVTASVYVKHTGVLDDPNSHLVNKIKRLVASSVTGLQFDNVTVIPDRARFSELPTKEKQADLEYVRVWTVVLAKDSLFRFQVIFFSFCIVLFIIFFYAFWVSWKIHPLLKKRGGIKQLFHLSPLPDEFEPEVKEEKKEEEPPKDGDKKPPEEPKGPKVQENVEAP